MEFEPDDSAPWPDATRERAPEASGAPISLRIPGELRKALNAYLADRPRESRSSLIIDLLDAEMRRFGYLPRREKTAAPGVDPADRLLGVAARLEETARVLRHAASER